MPSPDGPGADPEGLGRAREVLHEQVHSQLVEALILLLIEKGVLTKNDALSIVQTVAQVQKGLLEGDLSRERTLGALERLYTSFDALTNEVDRSMAEAENVRQLRRPIYEGRPDFPRDD